jgi:hypothetical protein
MVLQNPKPNGFIIVFIQTDGNMYDVFGVKGNLQGSDHATVILYIVGGSALSL